MAQLSTPPQNQDPDEALFVHKDFIYTRSMFEPDFEDDGSLRDIWWFGEPAELIPQFWTALKALNYEWSVDGRNQLKFSEFEALVTEPDSVAVHVNLSPNLLVLVWAFGVPHSDMEANISPKGISDANVGIVFNFLRNLGRQLNADIYIGGENTRDKVNPIDPEKGAFVRYDAARDSFERLSEPGPTFHSLVKRKRE